MNGVIIVAAGSGSRMKANINKQFIKLNDKEIIAYTIEKFYNNKNINDIVVVIKEDEYEFFQQEILDKYNFDNIKIAYGGKERQDSVYNGIKSLDKNCKYVLVHDGARPFVRKQNIEDGIKGVLDHGACVIGVPVKDTIKVIDENKDVHHTPRRSMLWAAQTPQCFWKKIIKKGYEYAIEEDIIGTDDSSLVEKIGYKVKMIMGNYDNIKITTPEDLIIAESLLKVDRNLKLQENIL